MARGDEITHPQQRWRFRYGDRTAQRGWQQCIKQVPSNAAQAWEAIVPDPRRTSDRRYRLKSSLSTGRQDGKTLEQWQHKITSGGRLGPERPWRGSASRYVPQVVPTTSSRLRRPERTFGMV